MHPLQRVSLAPPNSCKLTDVTAPLATKRQLHVSMMFGDVDIRGCPAHNLIPKLITRQHGCRLLRAPVLRSAGNRYSAGLLLMAFREGLDPMLPGEFVKLFGEGIGVTFRQGSVD